MEQEISQVKEVTFDIKKVFEDKRIDQYLASRLPDYSRTFIQKLIKEGAVLVNGHTVKSSYDIQKGDCISVHVPVLEESKIVPEEIPLNIVYEDDYLMLINKPYDMVVHPAGGHPSGTLVNALAFYCQNLSQANGPLKAGIVHRLDRDTSGIMLVIKSDAVHSHIAMQFEKRYVKKEYIAVVEGEIMFDSDEIHLPIGRHKTDRQKMAVRRDNGKEAVSIYEVMERFRGYTLVRIMPKTGRTHQIRVHMRSIGHPVVADFMYSNHESCYLSDLLEKERESGEMPIIERQALHAHRIGFFHPIQNKKMEFQVDLPEDISRLVKTLREIRPYRNSNN
ncbi:MAG: RluA family pseudouridine synthase [Candidatus Brocadia sp. AMX2]|uniref:Pseudouridine synthase n=1 Tax=Candidatus Brocadia sinica JPN1 TaxID=1197129 RepID=A0ABQ0JTS7_9BACT|nr:MULTISPECIES: RluA family pseudouridine synthase [Brocadia]KXK32343.1 MAG: pseudouridine synthase [Candidatus Brocadia sinica]MBC6933031.1 RluA family pseudouridine synthase [Candidatus Brocadia sp.]MBL1169084.1 RluA family pseudouridine synthase [Candidatus Brocadia sp. AMX1]NOG41970.1 RluA family pseudouridine synthase [Planctomycetota bacterium]KAA0243812.1 MAG: RluA family pseudouridine synthase [Candidatus Brocadia sp. AMX2]